MKSLLERLWRETDGVLSFEWTILTSVVTIGAVAGIAAVRDAVVDEMADVAEAMTSLDQSYRIQGPLIVAVHTPYPGGYGGTRVQEFRLTPAPPMTPERSGASGATGSAYQDQRGLVLRRSADPAPLPPPEAQGSLAAPAVDDNS